MRLLVTGFSPFPGRPENPSQRLVEALRREPPELAGVEWHEALLPVEYAAVGPEFLRLADQVRPDVVLAFGVGRQSVPFRLERRGVNRNHALLPDNAGEIRLDWPIDPEGPGEMDTPLDLWSLHRQLTDRGHPVQVSQDAGQYVCNHLVYTALRAVAGGRNFRFLFTHLAPAEMNVPLAHQRDFVQQLARWFQDHPAS